MTGRGFHGLWGFAGGTEAACVCDRRWLPTREFEAHLVAERVAAVLHDDATVEAVARADFTMWCEGEYAPTWDSTREAHRAHYIKAAESVLAVLAERLGVPHVDR